jgi:5-methylcytosine-specific restriction protein A
MNRTRAPQPKQVSWGTTKGKRITGRRLQRERERLFADRPLCAECERQGRVTPAKIRDHVRPLAFGGTDTEANTQPLCIACHDIKSKAEAAEGARRTRGGRKSLMPSRPETGRPTEFSQMQNNRAGD